MNMAVSQSFRNLAMSSIMRRILINDSLQGPIYFPNYGNGILLYTTTANGEFFIEIAQTEAEPFNDSSILLAVGSQKASFLAQHKGEPKELKTVNKSSIGENVGYDAGYRVTYWWSYDSDAMTIKYGKGYYMEETTFMSYTFKDQKDKTENRDNYFDPIKTKTVTIHDKYPWSKPCSGQVISKHRKLQTLTSAPTYIDLQREIAFSPQPLTYNRPAIVQDSSLSNLFDIDLGKYTYSSSLPDECKVLYANVTGVNMSMSYGEQEYKLTDAIRHSIEDKDGILHKKLKEKEEEGEFGAANEVYLRVTLGKDFGNSPGTPYVLEIWPKKCGSPVHDHGNACAVIRVLHGGLKIYIYNKQAKDFGNPRPLKSFDVSKDDVTWISPNWYQTHRLYNDTDDYCATIQCYQYGEADDIHWPYFDYINPETGHTDNFVPDADFHFTDMYNRVMKEYVDFMKGNRPKTSLKTTRKRKRKMY